MLSGFLIWRVGFVSTLFLGVLSGMFALVQAQGADIEEARTVVVNTLVVLEIFYLFSVRYLKAPSITWRGVLGTPAVLMAVGAVSALQLVFTYVPFMKTFFDTSPLSFAQGAQIIAAGILVLIILEIEKRIYTVMTRRGQQPNPAGRIIADPARRGEQ